METDAPGELPQEQPYDPSGYKLIPAAGVPMDEFDDEGQPGCLDIVAATAGLGCALSVRALIIIAAFAILFFGLRALGWNSGGGTSHIGPGPGHILREGLDGGAFVLVYLLHFKKELGRRIVNQIHACVDVLEEL